MTKRDFGIDEATGRDETSRVIVTTVRGCARCGGEHPGLVFRPLRVPFAGVDGGWTHWAPCPANGEPVLLRVVETDVRAGDFCDCTCHGDPAQMHFAPCCYPCPRCDRDIAPGRYEGHVAACNGARLTWEEYNR